EVTWNAGQVPSGVYFYRLVTDDKSLTRKMMLLK
ncbi:MAG TPA: T9SS type A sorting domain-containing protein, partial [candidate division Zixibacteria bacterium]|nr:T9SS type A sorting domain-containing protein [candidate division Zixibacteria bacterium]